MCGTATAEEAFARARAGDARANDGLAQLARYLGVGIANMVAVISPDRVVIGGGISAAFDLLLAPIQAELRRRVRTTSLDQVEIVAAELGTWAGAIGAAVHGAEEAARRGEAPAGSAAQAAGVVGSR
jgi:glucokinase